MDNMSMASSTLMKGNEHYRAPDHGGQVPPLPHVVWRCIVYHLHDSLPTLLDLAGLSNALQDICRPHISIFFQRLCSPVPPLSVDYYYHDLLRLIFKGHVDPELIYEFYPHNQHSNRPGTSAPARAVSSLSSGATNQEDHDLDLHVRQALKRSPFIPADLHSEVCTRFAHADQDAALVILLPMLTRLKVMEIPGNSPLCAALFESVGKEYRKQGVDDERARLGALELAIKDRTLPLGRKGPRDDVNGSIPFSELLILHSSAADHGCGLSLTEMVPFMCIPSVHRIVMEGVCDQHFRWRANDVTPTCPSFYFQQAEVSKSAALAFASGIDPPCDIRQWLEHHKLGHGYSNVQSVGWDRVLVERGPRGEKKVEARIDFEGGNPGYDHPWVSWLWHGKMLDWRRLDEEFAVEDGDVDIEWLQGILCW